MAKEVMRHEKAKSKSGISAIQRHNQATKEVVEAIQKADIKNYGSSDIILENLQYNKTMIKCEDFNKEIEKTLEQRLPNKTIRKDAVKLLDGIYTYSPEKTPYLMARLHYKDEEWKKKNKEMWEQYVSLPTEERQKKINEDYQWAKNYFRKCVEFERRHYGICISAEIHFHETTPHLHTNSIPLVVDKEKCKLSAKEIMGNKAKLSQMQTCFHEEVGKEFGLERGQMRVPGEIKKHITKEQKKLEETEKKLENITNRYNQIQADFLNLKESYDKLQGDYQEIVGTYVNITDRIEYCNEIIKANLGQMTAEIREKVREHSKQANKTREDVLELIKSGRTPNIVFGSLNKLSNEVKQIEDDLEEEGWER